MRSRLRRVVGIGILLLAAGCATGAGLAADLPVPRPLPTLQSLDDITVPPELRPANDVVIPVQHPPDALIVARQREAPRVSRLEMALLRVPPVVNWALLGLAVAAF